MNTNYKQGLLGSSFLGTHVGEGQKPTRLNGVSLSPVGKSLGFHCTCQKKQGDNAYLTDWIGVHQNTFAQQGENDCSNS